MPSDVLQTPLTLPSSGRTVQNRFLKSAMTERLCTYDKENLDRRGKPTEEYIRAYEEWGKGKLGVLVLGNTPVHREHLEAPGNAVIDRDNSWDAVEAFKPVIKASRQDGALVICQLTHAGRQSPSHVQPNPVSPSDNEAFDAMGMHFNDSRAMTIEEIKDYQQRVAYAAEVLYKAGADGFQLHAAHGYLLSQFLSPVTNRRTDQYGGSFENRARIIFETLDVVKERVPKEFVRSIKINTQDFKAEGGWTIEDCQTIVSQLEAAGVDIIELSGGTYESSAFEHKKKSTEEREGFFIELSEKLKPAVEKAVICVTGGFRTRSKCAQAIEDGATDMIGLARPLTADPQLPLHFFEGKADAAAPNLVDSAMQTPAAVLQIHSFAEKRPIYDLSDRKVADDITNIIKTKSPPAPKGDHPPM